MGGFIVAFFLLFYLATSGKYPVAETIQQDKTIPNITIGNTIFHAESFGNDTSDVVIVIHGGPGNDYRYLLDLKQLEDDYLVVFYDQRGTGLSPRVSKEELSLDTMLLDLDNIVNYYSKNRKVNLIGHSWGGMLASGYIAQHPNKVRKAVLAEPGMLTSEKAAEFLDKFQIKMNMKLLYFVTKTWFQQLHIREPDKQAGMDYFFARIGLAEIEGNPMASYYCNMDPATASMDHWRFSWSSSQEIMKKGMDESGNLIIDLVSGLENFGEKVLFLSGACNSIIGPDYQKYHMKYFPNAEMVVIDNAGHTMIGERPEACLEVIREYFEE